ncbi:hypothetical protein [Niabella sp.]|uniref:hypothetical protein n=1 Tax=Niabella sp. TaxID=1962976 RepID=UPI00261C0415|nr:hypothetical protein [Niabella sp.]
MLKRKKSIQGIKVYRNPFQRVKEKVIAQQHQLADWMQRKTRHWKKKQQKIFLFILCLVLGGSSIYRVLELFEEKTNPTVLNMVNQQSNPPIAPPAPMMHPTVRDTNIFYRFRSHIDSLLRTPEGRRRYDEFLKERPGFLDSLAFAEKISK